MSHSGYQMFFNYLRLGDGLVNVPNFNLVTEAPRLKPGSGAARKHGHANGLNAHFEFETPAHFRVRDGESQRAFWSRVRQFPLDYLAAAGSGEVGDAGSLYLVVDPLGGFKGERDSSTLQAAAAAGTDVTVQTDDIIHTDVTTGWQAGHQILFIEGTTFELVPVSAIVNGNGFEATLANSYGIGAEVHRVSWIIPEVWLPGGFRLPALPTSDSPHVPRVDLTWHSVVNPVDGGLT